MGNRFQYVIIGLVSTAVLALVFGLRHQASRMADGPAKDSTSIELGEDGRGRSLWNDIGGRTQVSLVEERTERRAARPTPKRTPAPQRKEDFEAELARSAGDASIYGIVTNREEQPVGGAAVKLFVGDPTTTYPALRETVADAGGSFTLSQLNDNRMSYILVAHAPGYAYEATFVRLSDGSTRRDMRLEPGVTVEGIVRNAETSAPLSGAEIAQAGRFIPLAMLGTIQSGPDGKFKIEHIREGRISASATLDGYQPATGRGRAPAEEPIEIAMRPGGGTFRGVVLDRASGEPVESARVTASVRDWRRAYRKSVATGLDGTFELRNMPEGEYEVFAQLGMRSEEQEFALANGEIKEGLEFVVPSPVIVSGKVIDSQSRKALPGIAIGYDSTSGRRTIVSDETGRFGFETMAVDEYRLYVNQRGYIPVSGDKQATEVQRMIVRKVDKDTASEEIVLEMKPVPFVEGKLVSRARGGENRPVNRAAVSLAYRQGRETGIGTTSPNVEGEFFINLTDDRRGQGLILAQGWGGIALADTRVPRPRPINMTLQNTQLQGQLLMSDQSPLTGVRVDSFYRVKQGNEEAEIAGQSTVARNQGRFSMLVAEYDNVELRFNMPDGKVISKSFNGSELINKRGLFMYDPSINDIVYDLSQAERGGRGGRGEGGGGPRGEGVDRPRGGGGNSPAQQAQ